VSGGRAPWRSGSTEALVRADMPSAAGSAGAALPVLRRAGSRGGPGGAVLQPGVPRGGAIRPPTHRVSEVRPVENADRELVCLVFSVAHAPVMRPSPLVVDDLAALQQQVADLERRMAALEAARSTLSRADVELLQRLLPAWAGAVGSEPVLVGELLRYPAIELVLAGMPARRLGRLLRRCTGRPVDAYIVKRLGREDGAVIWGLMEAD
jgi:hypothetical protein